MNFKELIERKEYDFLRNNINLKDKILFLCLGGSYAYGTNNSNSDIDIRGVAFNSFTDLIGITEFEQFIDKDTDTVIYSLNKFVDLASKGNPNIIEMLFCEKEHYLYVSSIGKILLENRDIFLSKKLKYTFAGYANAQLNRIENALVRDGKTLTEYEQKTYINRSLTNAYKSFIDRYQITEDAMKTYVDKTNTGYDLFIDLNLKHVRVGSLKEMNDQLNNVINDFSRSIGNKNHKKDDYHLNKHMMHLVRLFLTCIEALKTNSLHTYRKEDLDLLLKIKNGYFRDENGGIKDGFYQMIKELSLELDEAYNNTTLANNVDKNKVEDLLKTIYLKLFNKDYIGGK